MHDNRLFIAIVDLAEWIKWQFETNLHELSSSLSIVCNKNTILALQTFFSFCLIFPMIPFNPDIFDVPNPLENRQQEKGSEYQTLVLNKGPFGNVLAVSFLRQCACLRSRTFVFYCSIQKRRYKLGR